MSRDSLSSRLHHYVEIQQPSFSADGGGGSSISWNTFANIWAEIRPLRTVEHTDALQNNVIPQHRITVRFRDDITTKMRIIFETRVFYIRSITNVNENKEILELLCEEGEPR